MYCIIYINTEQKAQAQGKPPPKGLQPRGVKISWINQPFIDLPPLQQPASIAEGGLLCYIDSYTKERKGVYKHRDGIAKSRAVPMPWGGI